MPLIDGLMRNQPEIITNTFTLTTHANSSTTRVMLPMLKSLAGGMSIATTFACSPKTMNMAMMRRSSKLLWRGPRVIDVIGWVIGGLEGEGLAVVAEEGSGGAGGRGGVGGPVGEDGGVPAEAGVADGVGLTAENEVGEPHGVEEVGAGLAPGPGGEVAVEGGAQVDAPSGGGGEEVHALGGHGELSEFYRVEFAAHCGGWFLYGFGHQRVSPLQEAV